MSALPPFTNHFAVLAKNYEVVLSDVWGVVHNGVAASPEACDALARFRNSAGGTVILITNAPRPGEVVASRTLDRLKVPRAAYDGIISSGDVTRALIAARAGQRVFHIGPERDLPIFDGLDARVAPLEHADYVVCSGLYDDTVETPQDYDDLIAAVRARALTMICANPDIVVERGEQLVYCAGAIADLYAAACGEVIYAGKPYRPIYDQALALAAAARGRPAERRRVLAIGDFGAHRPQRRGGVRDRLPVCDGGHPRRGAGRTRKSRRRSARRYLRRGWPVPEGGDAPTGVVIITPHAQLPG